MAAGRLAAAAPYVERLAENEYVQDRLTEAAENLRAAYARASQRSAVKAAQDRKLQRRVGRALVAARDAAVALRTGRKPKRRSRGRVVLIGVAVVGAGVVASGPVRRKLSGNEEGAQPASSSDVQTSAPAAQPSAA